MEKIIVRHYIFIWIDLRPQNREIYKYFRVFMTFLEKYRPIIELMRVLDHEKFLWQVYFGELGVR